MEALSEIVPLVVAAAPRAKATVRYPSGVSAELGNELTPTQVKDKPEVAWEAEPDALYTLIMTDPDAPSATDRSLSEVRHWLVVNIPGCRVTDGDEVSVYRGSGAPEGTGLHRYVFLVFRQRGRLTVEPSLRQTFSQVSTRRRWSAQAFVEKYGLETPAAAGNMFRAQFDDYVPVLKQMTE